MSARWPGGIIRKTPVVPSCGVAPGIWSMTDVANYKKLGLWPTPPQSPTIGTATAGNSLCASVTFTAPTCKGVPATITGYAVTSSPGCITATGASSPLTVTGLTEGTSYTFKVKAQNASGYGPCSAASNSITAKVAVVGQQAYTSPGTYTWVAPSGVTKVSVVAVGGGAGGGWAATNGGGGGALAYKNDISVTPGSSYTVVVGVGGTGRGYPNTGTVGGESYFINTSTVQASGGSVNGAYSTYVGDGGGRGGWSRQAGGGAGGYAGDGGLGGGVSNDNATAGAGGGGGGGAGGYYNTDGTTYDEWGTSGSGGGVGILGQGSNGSRGVYNSNPNPGGGGSGGTTPSTPGASSNGVTGGLYGGGGGNGYTYADICGFVSSRTGGNGGGGAVRIIWPGCTRQFPSTGTGNL